MVRLAACIYALSFDALLTSANPILTLIQNREYQIDCTARLGTFSLEDAQAAYDAAYSGTTGQLQYFGGYAPTPKDYKRGECNVNARTEKPNLSDVAETSVILDAISAIINQCVAVCESDRRTGGRVSGIGTHRNVVVELHGFAADSCSDSDSEGDTGAATNSGSTTTIGATGSGTSGQQGQSEDGECDWSAFLGCCIHKPDCSRQ